jgi:hypothetical protein
MSDFYIKMDVHAGGWGGDDKVMSVVYTFDSVPEMMTFKDRIDALYKESEKEEHDCDCDCDQCAADRWEDSRDSHD